MKCWISRKPLLKLSMFHKQDMIMHSPRRDNIQGFISRAINHLLIWSHISFRRQWGGGGVGGVGGEARLDTYYICGAIAIHSKCLI